MKKNLQSGFDELPPTRLIRKHPRAKLADGTGVSATVMPTVTARYDRAVDFVAQYADHLTQGGLFVQGAFQIEPMTEIELHLEVPGFGAAMTAARVVYHTDGGVGVDISCADDSFFATLHRILLRLGERRTVSVVTSMPSLAPSLEAAGFDVAVATHPVQVVRLFSSASGRIAVVVDPADFEATSGFVDSSFLVPYQSDFALLVAALDALD